MAAGGSKVARAVTNSSDAESVQAVVSQTVSTGKWHCPPKHWQVQQYGPNKRSSNGIADGGWQGVGDKRQHYKQEVIESFLT
jgi:hypothetical protein